MPDKNPTKILISYAHRDRDMMLELKKHLISLERNGVVDVWDDAEILAGNNWEIEIDNQLEVTDIIIFLVSADFMADDFIQDKVFPKVLKRKDTGKSHFVPILVNYVKCDYLFQGLEMLPKSAQSQPVPIADYPSPAKAFTEIVIELERIIDVTKASKTSGNKVPTGAASIRALTVKNVWDSIPLKKGVSKSKLLQLDRTKAFIEIRQPLDDCANGDQNLFYFISACKTQSPDNIAKRLFYFYDDVFIPYHCLRLTDDKDSLEDVYVHELEIKRNPELSWRAFWPGFKSYLPMEWNLQVLQTEVQEDDFDVFKRHASTLMPSDKRFAFFCRVANNEWANEPNISDHLQYIIRQFSEFPAGSHRFVFFFFIELDGFHDCQCNPPCEATLRFEKIKKICSDQYHYPLTPYLKQVELRDSVTEKDVKSWLDSLIDDNRRDRTLDDYFDLLIQALLKELDEKERAHYEQYKSFNMERLVMMQRHAYNLVK